jgi:ppGpp synthetase/RelA/SpoT-type nucleotidyltranferase
LPICKHSERLKRLNLEFKLLKDNYSQTTEQPPPTLVASEIKDLDYIINLQIFKHELKTTFNAKSIVDYIFGFKFITDIKKDQVDTSKILLHRNP